MSKLAQNFAKYMVQAEISSTGIVEKPDVIGAVFGQTEGLLGSDLDLRELQRTGRIGRIEVSINNKNGKSTAIVEIPSSLDASETALIAASLETIDKIGPADAKVVIKLIEDVRSQKRNFVIKRAKTLLSKLIESIGLEDSQQLSEEIKESIRSSEIITYKGLSAGPDMKTNDEIIVVEGRADVVNLLKNGIRNVVAIEGSKIPDTIVELSKEKIVTAFLDGDRGGDLDLKKLLMVADIDFIARAEKGKEVEDLYKKQIFKALRDKTPSDQIKEPVNIDKTEVQQPKELTDEIKERLKKKLNDLTGTRAAYLFDGPMKNSEKVPLSEINADLNKNVKYVIMDAKINQDIIDICLKSKVEIVVGTGYSSKKISKDRIKTFSEKEL